MEWFVFFLVINCADPCEHPTWKKYKYHDLHFADPFACQREAIIRNAHQKEMLRKYDDQVYWLCEYTLPGEELRP